MIVLNGFVKIHRKLIQWGWYQDNVVKGVFLHLLLTASFKDAPWQGRTIHAGQVVTSYKRLAEDLGFGVQQVRTAVEKLVSTQEITCEATNKYTLITIVNWDDYQVLEEDTKRQVYDSKGQQTKNESFSTKKEIDGANVENGNTQNNKQNRLGKAGNIEDFENGSEKVTCALTNNQQTTNIQITNSQQHRKNVKEYKEGKEIKREVFSEYASGNEKLLEALEDFEQMRKSIKKPMTDRARQMLCRKLSELKEEGEDEIACLEEAILHNWMTVYPLGEKRKEKKDDSAAARPAAREAELERTRRLIEERAKRLGVE